MSAPHYGDDAVDPQDAAKDARIEADCGRPISAVNDGGPVASTIMNQEVTIYPHGGLSIRDWFAGQETLREYDNPEASMPVATGAALAGEPFPEGGWHNDPIACFKWEAKWRASLKLIRADAMLAARGGMAA